MKPWPLVILILALGSSAINAWYFGSLIYDDRARANEAATTTTTAGTIHWDNIGKDQEVWFAHERRDWRVLVTVEIAILTLAFVSYALVRSSRSAARP